MGAERTTGRHTEQETDLCDAQVISFDVGPQIKEETLVACSQHLTASPALAQTGGAGPGPDNLLVFKPGCLQAILASEALKSTDSHFCQKCSFYPAFQSLLGPRLAAMIEMLLFAQIALIV